jgi:hypothetical protein
MNTSAPSAARCRRIRECSVRDATLTCRSTPSTSPTSATSSAPVSSAPSPTGSANARLVDDERMAKLQRSRWTDAVTQHVVCADGQHLVDSNADAVVVEVTGDCREVTIVASGAIVLLPALDELTIEGDGNIVIVAAAREIELPPRPTRTSSGGRPAPPS